MANVDSPRGFWPAVGTGGSTTPRLREYAIKPGAPSIGQGDVVVMTATGASLYVAGNTAIIGTAAAQWTSGGTLRTVRVFDDPEQQFVGQQDGAISAAAAAVGNYFSLVVVARNSTTLMSKFEIDTSTSATAQALHPIQVIAISRRVNDSAVAASWTDCVVQFNPNFHLWAKGGLGI